MAMKRADDVRCCCIGENGTNATLGLAINRAATVATANFILLEVDVIERTKIQRVIMRRMLAIWNTEDAVACE